MAERFLASLAAHGIDFLFANPGTDFPPIVEALARAAQSNAKIPRAIVVPHENLAMAMAHGACLMTGRPQAVMVHVNVGTANTINILANVARDRVPLLLCAGRTPITEGGQFGSRNRPIHWAQEMFDQAGMVREFVKWDYEFKAPGLVDAVVARALEIAQTAPQGPVYLTLPREPLSAPGGDMAITQPRAIPTRAAADLATITAIAALLARAERPVIVAGASGRDVVAVDALAAFADALAVPVVSANPQVVNLPTDHAMHFVFDSALLLEDADLVLVLECDVPWNQPSEAPPASAKVVHIGEDPAFQRYPMRTFRADLMVTSTVANALTALGQALSPPPAKVVAARRKRLAKQQAERHQAIAKAAKPAADRITPAHLSRAISDIAGDDALIFNEYPLLLDQVIRRSAHTFFGLSPAGGLGWGLGAAIGAKMAAPEKLVIATLGDGAYLFSNPTACHWMQAAAEAPVLTVLFNNSRYNAVRRATLHMFKDGAAGREDGTLLADLGPSPPYHEFVTSQGGLGLRVEKPGDLAEALARARDAVVNKRQQALLNVICPY